MVENCKTEIAQLLTGGASKVDAAYTIIRKMILANELDADQLLSERALGKRLGISRTPIRSALHRLSYEGFVDIKSETHTIVARLNIEDTLELYELREGLECKAVELFTKRKTKEEEEELLRCYEAHKKALLEGDTLLASEMDNRTHMVIANGSKNKRLQSILQTHITLSLRSVTIGTQGYRFRHSLEQHKQVIDSILNDQPLEAAINMRNHIADVRNFFKDQFANRYG